MSLSMYGDSNWVQILSSPNSALIAKVDNNGDLVFDGVKNVVQGV